MDDQHDLQTLIETRRRALDLTYAGLSARATEAGHPLSMAMFQHLATRPLGKLTARTIRAVAAALDVSQTQVLDAAARSLGVQVRRTDTTRDDTGPTSALMASLDRPRPAAQRDALHAILASTVAAFDQMAEGS